MSGSQKVLKHWFGFVKHKNNQPLVTADMEAHICLDNGNKTVRCYNFEVKRLFCIQNLLKLDTMPAVSCEGHATNIFSKRGKKSQGNFIVAIVSFFILIYFRKQYTKLSFPHHFWVTAGSSNYTNLAFCDG